MFVGNRRDGLDYPGMMWLVLKYVVIVVVLMFSESCAPRDCGVLGSSQKESMEPLYGLRATVGVGLSQRDVSEFFFDASYPGVRAMVVGVGDFPRCRNVSYPMMICIPAGGVVLADLVDVVWKLIRLNGPLVKSSIVIVSDEVSHGEMVQVLDALNGAGITIVLLMEEGDWNLLERIVAGQT